MTPTSGPTTLPLSSISPALISLFKELDFTSAGLTEYLGPDTMAALFRGEPGAVLYALRGRDTEPRAILTTVFLLHRSCAHADLATLMSDKFIADLVAAHVLVESDEGLTSCIDIRPHVIGDVDRWVFSDMDASMLPAYVPGRTHVLGVGAASLSLLATTPRTPVKSVLDLGAGSGVQALGQFDCAEAITVTDINPRAMELAEATLLGAQETTLETKIPVISYRQGSWFAPVEDEKFDRIISNPPFVVGLPEVGHIYRDSGLELDGATARVVEESPNHLLPGGHAHLLGAWIHKDGEDWRQRIASWFPETGVAAWVLQRDLVDPALYVGTWLRDENVDPRTSAGEERTQRWLSYFADEDVTGIGFGYIAIEKLPDSEPSEIIIEEFAQAYDGDISAEIEEYFIRRDWLAAQSPDSLLSSQFQLRPEVAKEDVSVTDAEIGMGFAPRVVRITRTDGPRFSHEIDDSLASLISGLHPQGLPLEDVLDLFAGAQGLDADVLKEQAVGLIADLVRHGILLPASLIGAPNEWEA